MTQLRPQLAQLCPQPACPGTGQRSPTSLVLEAKSVSDNCVCVCVYARARTACRWGLGRLYVRQLQWCSHHAACGQAASNGHGYPFGSVLRLLLYNCLPQGGGWRSATLTAVPKPLS